MATPLPFDDKTPPEATTLRIVIISALVALVVGCIPALGAGIIYADNIRVNSEVSSKANCDAINYQRNLLNQRSRLIIASLESDVDNVESDYVLLQASQDRTKARGDKEGAQILQGSLDAKQRSIDAKKKLIAKQTPIPLRDC